MLKSSILIPAYQPDERLVDLCEHLEKAGFDVVVIDDGSGEQYKDIFAQLKIEKCISYVPNRGKGYALKKGLSYLAQNGYDVAITADADGQHAVEDIFKLAQAAENHEGKLILGVRDIAQMPPRSHFGNSLTKTLLKLIFNIEISDTQTGLRSIPLRRSDKLLSISGERYEFETNMLIRATDLFDGIEEVPIQTIYIGKNETSHFNPVKDGLKIYGLLFRNLPHFLIISFLSFLVDYLLFNGLIYLGKIPAVGSTVLARALSSVFNFCLNKKYVFPESNHYTIIQYYMIALAILAANCLLIFIFVDLMHGSAFLAKLVVECILYLVSYIAQNRVAHKK